MGARLRHRRGAARGAARVPRDPQRDLAHRAARVQAAQRRPSGPAFNRGSRRMGCNTLSHEPRAVQGSPTPSAMAPRPVGPWPGRDGRSGGRRTPGRAYRAGSAADCRAGRPAARHGPCRPVPAAAALGAATWPASWLRGGPVNARLHRSVAFRQQGSKPRESPFSTGVDTSSTPSSAPCLAGPASTSSAPACCGPLERKAAARERRENQISTGVDNNLQLHRAQAKLRTAALAPQNPG